MNQEPTVEEDYEQSLLRLVDVTAKLMRAAPDTIEELCAEGRNMVQPLLMAVEELDDSAWMRISRRMYEHNIPIKFRGRGVAPHDRVMRLIFLVTKLSMPQGRPVQLLCDSALAQLDQIEEAAKTSSAA